MAMGKDIAIVFDCGATNVRVVAIDSKGNIHATYSLPNESSADPFYENGRIWDLEILWTKLSKASQEVMKQIAEERIAGVTITTFGVDGTFADRDGNIHYPVISWQCPRTKPVMDDIESYMPLSDLYMISGVYPFSFNTINKLIWFRENRPDIIDNSDQFVFISSLLIGKLCGQIKNDITMLGTGMIADIENRNVSNTILKAIGIERKYFGELANPGEIAGNVIERASENTGIPQGVPVIFAGHDTQFAIYGSGADINQPVLSSGTWEILMTRSRYFRADKTEFVNAITTEMDAIPGCYDIGQNWLGSAILEWFSKRYYGELSGDDLYERMIKDAGQVLPTKESLVLDISMFNESSIQNFDTIVSFPKDRPREQSYRLLLEGLAYRLKDALESLESAGNFTAEKIICVGGGSKNRLWNQIRADVCNRPIQLIDQKETTVLGASMFVFAAKDPKQTVEDYRTGIDYKPEIINPSENCLIYKDLYRAYLSMKDLRK
jgi:L-fuculokinase